MHHVDMSHLVVALRVKSPEVSEVDRIYSCLGATPKGEQPGTGTWSGEEPVIFAA